MSAQGLFFGPQIGFSRVSFIEKNALGTVDQNFKLGYQVGAAAEFEVMSFIYVGASVCFFQKGQKIVGDDYKSKLKLGYIDVPLYVGYKVPLGNISVFGNVGPYTSVAIVGESYYYSDMGGIVFEETHDVELGGDTGWYKRFDTGVTIGGGFEFKQYQIKANYSLGFVDIVPGDWVSAKNSVFNITATYFIGRDY
ncbi:MAG: hypothetical protein C0596_08000 [Marinilabiliales bacterium]|nr:MAG: hypothetical protein C0596_08000 [Marinilabiliales bacterium]